MRWLWSSHRFALFNLHLGCCRSWASACEDEDSIQGSIYLLQIQLAVQALAQGLKAGRGCAEAAPRQVLLMSRECCRQCCCQQCHSKHMGGQQEAVRGYSFCCLLQERSPPATQLGEGGA